MSFTLSNCGILALFVELVCLLVLWGVTRSAFVADAFRRTMLDDDTLAALPGSIYMFLSLWLAFVLLWLIPLARSLAQRLGFVSLARQKLQIHPKPGSKLKPRSKKARSGISAFWSIVYLLATWTKLIFVGLVAWFLMQLVQALETYAEKLAFDTSKIEDWQNAQNVINKLFGAFTWCAFTIVLLFLQQNGCFYALGAASASNE